MPADNAARVVEDARNLSPNLGDRMLTAHLAGRPVIIRELLPQDLKLDIETLPQAEALGGWPLTRFDHWQGPRAPAGRGRARGVGGGMRRHRFLHLDAPAWLNARDASWPAQLI